MTVVSVVITCQNHNVYGNYTLRVEITLDCVIITLVCVSFTRIRVKIILVCVDTTICVSHYACGNRTLRVEINLLRVESHSCVS
jgi:hypothetical protein